MLPIPLKDLFDVKGESERFGKALLKRLQDKQKKRGELRNSKSGHGGSIKVERQGRKQGGAGGSQTTTRLEREPAQPGDFPTEGIRQRKGKEAFKTGRYTK